MNKIFIYENLDLIEHKLYELTGEWYGSGGPLAI